MWESADYSFNHFDDLHKFLVAGSIRLPTFDTVERSHKNAFYDGDTVSLVRN